MTQETARRILHSFLAEKGIAVPAPEEQDSEAAIRLLVERTLSSEASGALPESLARALAETFDAVAAAAETPAPDGNPEKTGRKP